MAQQFSGGLMIDIETDRDVTPEKFKAFKRAWDNYVMDDLTRALYDLAADHGFEIDSVQPIYEDETNKLQATD